jgi:iron-sulfur cluster insertion protein
MLGSITITPAAAAQINKVRAQKGDDDLKFRITVLGGGCSGFKYQFEFDKTQNEWDLVFTLDGATILVDDLSIQFIKDAELDFEKSLSGARFVVNNPNAASGCGCGVSFSYVPATE